MALHKLNWHNCWVWSSTPPGQSVGFLSQKKLLENFWRTEGDKGLPSKSNFILVDLKKIENFSGNTSDGLRFIKFLYLVSKQY